MISKKEEEEEQEKSKRQKVIEEIKDKGWKQTLIDHALNGEKVGYSYWMRQLDVKIKPSKSSSGFHIEKWASQGEVTDEEWYSEEQLKREIKRRLDIPDMLYFGSVTIEKYDLE